MDWKRFLIDTFSLLIVIQLVSNIQSEHVLITALAALILAFLNRFIFPILVILTIPINLLSLGLFTFLINGFLFKLTGALTPGFHVIGFWSAIWGAILFSIFRILTEALVRSNTSSRVD